MFSVANWRALKFTWNSLQRYMYHHSKTYSNNFLHDPSYLRHSQISCAIELNNYYHISQHVKILKQGGHIHVDIKFPSISLTSRPFSLCFLFKYYRYSFL